ncbi:sugar phosphate isomerase/epimerase [Paenibacillus sp. IB182496]|uniref:Sugar phosphate isomerase/epimerase n=1 Tax=Paenibacillus sabuli TaxID=2772509 RepID=A0A927BWE0_9BACL|nr:sugar phosphate isomerase/epimerase [Paenibacillus sabuli]MBD2848096.1 sugar phosphate isomerase/epimerase [Paenibacillus sabuli]
MMRNPNLPFTEIGCSTIAFREFSLQAALEQIAALGFDFVDIGANAPFCGHFDFFSMGDDEIQQRIAWIRSYPVRVHSITTDIGSFNDPYTDSQRCHEAAARSLATAAALGATGLNVNNGKHVDRASHSLAESVAQVAPHLRRVSQEAQQLGLELYIEAPHKGGLIRTADEAIELIEAIDHPNASLIFDTDHHEAAGWGMEQAIERLREQIGHVHLRDSIQGANRYPLGSGHVDFRAAFAALERIGRPLSYALEFSNCGESLEEIAETLQKSVAYLDSI